MKCHLFLELQTRQRLVNLVNLINLGKLFSILGSQHHKSLCQNIDLLLKRIRLDLQKYLDLRIWQNARTTFV